MSQQALYRRFGDEARQLFRLAWPNSVSSVMGFSPRIGMLIAVGHLPNGAMLVGAAGAGSMYANFAHLMLIRSSVFGASPLLSQAHGAGNHVRVGVVLMRVLAFHAAMILLLSLPLTALVGPLLTACGQPAATVQHAQLFVWVRLLGLPGMTVTLDLTTFLNAQRCARLPMAVSTTGALLQVVLSFGLVRRLGFVGAPLAMTLGELIAALALLLAAPHALNRHRLRSWPRWRRDAREALRGWGEIRRQGGPAAVMVMSEWFGWEVTLFMAGGLCDGESACSVVDSIPICTTVFVCQFILNFGWGLAVSNRVGNLLGEGSGQAARFSAGVAWVLAASCAACLGGVIVIMRRQIAAVFVDANDAGSAEVLEVTASLMPITTSYSILATLAAGWSQQVLFGLGARLHVPAALNFLAFYAFGIPGGALLCYRAELGVHGIWLGLVGAIMLVIIGQYTFLGCTVDWAAAAAAARKKALCQGPGGEQQVGPAQSSVSDGQGLASADGAKAIHAADLDG